MANYSGCGRTNYVTLRDAAAYARFTALVELLGGSTDERVAADGTRQVAAFGEEEEEYGDFKNFVYVEELVESGYVSAHADSPLNATLPAHLTQVADPTHEDETAEVAADFLYEAYPLLATGETLILQKIGHEKLRYLCGSAEAVHATGQTVSLTLDDIYELARTTFTPELRPAA